MADAALQKTEAFDMEAFEKLQGALDAAFVIGFFENGVGLPIGRYAVPSLTVQIRSAVNAG